MTLDPKSGNYTARIPAEFRDPKWDLMYFVEVVDKRGAGRMFPEPPISLPPLRMWTLRGCGSGP